MRASFIPPTGIYPLTKRTPSCSVRFSGPESAEASLSPFSSHHRDLVAFASDDERFSPQGLLQMFII